MLTFDDLDEFGGWYESDRQKFLSKEDLKKVENVKVVERFNSKDGEGFLVMVFTMINGRTKSGYLSKFSSLGAGDNVDPASVEIIELTNDEEEIYRYDGDKLSKKSSKKSKKASKKTVEDEEEEEEE